MTTTPSVSPRPPVLRLDSLTGLRWWAAFGVFLHHMSNFAPLPVSSVLSYGTSGVAFFFVLSGFVLTWSARPTTTAPTFWWRRFARIYPAHLIALLFAIPIFYSFAPDPAAWWVKPVDIGVLLLSVVLLQGWSRDPVVLFSGNPAAWTLTCEAFFYFLHPFINRFVRVLKLRGALAVCAGAIGVAFALKAATIIWPEVGMLPLPVSRLTEFVLGMGLAAALLNGWRFRFPPIWTFVIIGVTVVVFAYSERWIAGNALVALLSQFKAEAIIVLCGLTIIAVASRDARGERSLLSSRIMVILGDCSYAFYLVHATLVYGARELFGVQNGGWSSLGWYAILLVISFAAAGLLHYFVERPLEKKLRGWWDRRAEARRDARDVDIVPSG